MPPSVATGLITDSGPISSISKRVVTLMFLVALVDSYDQISLAFAAPSLVREWGIPRSAMGPIFSAQMLGLMIGGILFGYVGDRLGRKFAVVSGMLLFGTLSLLTVAAGSITELLIIRFFVGVGVGGVIPNAIALSNEFSPKRYQVTAVALMFVGYVFGGVGGGMVSAWLIPQFGWEVVFFVGGIIPILLASLLVFTLPESIKFLAMSSTGKRQQEAARIAALMRPDLGITSATMIVNDAAATEKFVLRDLFVGKLKVMTLLVWLAYIANSITAFGLISWMPILIEGMGFDPKAAAMGTALLFAAAALGGLVMSRFVDRFGLSPLILMPAIGIPFVAGIGFLSANMTLILYILTTMTGFFVFGFQNSLHGVAGSIYPTSIRALGVGWALSIGKIGGIIGPFIGGVMMSYDATAEELFVAAAVPLLVSVASVAMLRGLYNSHIHVEANAARPVSAEAG